ncbi:MAG: monovalent cation/H+ antiporter subunit D family protein [Actinomycetales bacterium]
MTGAVLPLFLGVPLVLGGALVIIGDRPVVHRIVTFAVLTASLAAAVGLVVHLQGGGAMAHGVGSWPVGIAIPFVADMFSALMLVVTGILALACAAFAHASGRASSRFFGPMVLVLMAGVNGALLTGDLFNLFVCIEVMLLPSYGLFVIARRNAGTLTQMAGARLYVTLNMLTSTVFMAGVGLIYGAAGTVNLAELAGAAREDPLVASAAAVCLFALGIKAAVVPVHGWLANAYPATSPAVTALFSGLHTKVAIYAIYRIYAVVFDGDTRYLWIGVLLFSATMVVGVLGAVGESTTRSILAFHMVSQIGYILLGVALFTQVGLTAGIFYLLHHMIVKASLFLSTGAIEVGYGTGTIGEVSGMARRHPVVGIAFLVAALSLAGLPPFSGFVAKLSLINGAVDAGQVAAVVTMLAVSLVTLLSMLKIWSGVFWDKKEPAGDDAGHGAAGHADGEDTGDSTTAVGPASSTAPSSGSATVVAAPAPAVATTTEAPARRIGFALAAPGVALAAVTLCLGLGGELLLSLSETAALGLLDTTDYVEAVIGR